MQKRFIVDVRLGSKYASEEALIESLFFKLGQILSWSPEFSRDLNPFKHNVENGQICFKNLMVSHNTDLENFDFTYLFFHFCLLIFFLFFFFFFLILHPLFWLIVSISSRLFASSPVITLYYSIETQWKPLRT